MTQSLMRKLANFPTQGHSVDATSVENTRQSTLIEADVSLFHETPASMKNIGHNKSDGSPAISDYDQGYEAGRKSAADTFEQTIDLLQNCLTELQTQTSQIQMQVEKSHLSALSSILNHLLPEMAKDSIRRNIQSVLQKVCTPTLQGQILMRVHPEYSDICEAVCRKYMSDIKITTDESIAIGQVQMNWENGGAIIDPEKTARVCLEILESAQEEERQND